MGLYESAHLGLKFTEKAFLKWNLVWSKIAMLLINESPSGNSHCPAMSDGKSPTLNRITYRLIKHNEHKWNDDFILSWYWYILPPLRKYWKEGTNSKRLLIKLLSGVKQMSHRMHGEPSLWVWDKGRISKNSAALQTGGWVSRPVTQRLVVRSQFRQKTHDKQLRCMNVCEWVSVTCAVKQTAGVVTVQEHSASSC